VRGRVDRVDRLPGGGYELIDYKTGRPSPNDWMGERPGDPRAETLQGGAFVVEESIPNPASLAPARRRAAKTSRKAKRAVTKKKAAKR